MTRSPSVPSWHGIIPSPSLAGERERKDHDSTRQMLTSPLVSLWGSPFTSHYPTSLQRIAIPGLGGWSHCPCLQCRQTEDASSLSYRLQSRQLIPRCSLANQPLESLIITSIFFSIESNNETKRYSFTGSRKK